MRIIILLALVIAAPFCPAAAQEGDPCWAKAYPYMIRNEKPNVYLAFEKAEKQNVLLRLRNSSRLAVLVLADKLYLAGSTPLTLCNGARTRSFKNGSRINVKYEVEDGGRALEPVSAGKSDTRFGMWLPPGRSVIFPVNRRHLSRDRRIYVSLVYEIDAGLKDGGSGPRVHPTYLSPEELSKALGEK